MNEQYQYRLATYADLIQLRALGVASYGRFADILGEEMWMKMRTNLDSENTYTGLLDIATCFICERNNRIIGMAFLIPHGNATAIFHEDWCYIRLIGVLPEYDGQGIGRKLTQLCIDKAKADGEQVIALHTAEFQNAARHIYESIGFVQQKELDRIYGKRYFLYSMLLHR